MQILKKSSIRLIAATGLALASMVPHVSAGLAQQATVRVALKRHRFVPAQPKAPAGQPFTILLKNLDATPAEFESKTLRVEKVVVGGGEISIQMRPLHPGRYRFFDDFHEDTTEGYLIVE